MRLPVGAAATLARAGGRALATTWRYRYAAAGPGPETAAAGEEGEDWKGAGEEGGSSVVAGEGDRDWKGPERPGSVPDASLPLAVYALWHEHLLPLAALHAGQGAAVLVSGHRDGEILARVMARWGYLPARGSSTRGGEAGLRQIVQAARAGRPVAITPDGPRGPARHCKPGVVRAAAASGLPIVPVAVAASRSRRLRSWDRFLVPAPGAIIYVAYGRPLAVPASIEPPLGGGRSTRRHLDRGATRPDEATQPTPVRGAGEGDEPVDPVLEEWTTRVTRALGRALARCEASAGRGAG